MLNSENKLIPKTVLNQLSTEKWPIKFEQLPKGSALVGGAVRDCLLNQLNLIQI